MGELVARCLFRLVFHHNFHRSVPSDDQLQRLSLAVVDRLVDGVGRDVDEVSRPDEKGVFQLITDDKSPLTSNHIDHRLAVYVVVRT